jgi:hypothetical protein
MVQAREVTALEWVLRADMLSKFWVGDHRRMERSTPAEARREELLLKATLSTSALVNLLILCGLKGGGCCSCIQNLL